MRKTVYPPKFLLQLALLSLALMIPYFALITLKYPVLDDHLTYAFFLHSYSHQFWQGEIFPRWLQELNAGLGSVGFIFTAPLSYYLGVLLEPLSGIDPHGIIRLGLTMGIALFIAGLTSYHWLGRFFSPEEAKKGALLYVSFPYISTVIYFSFAPAHLLAFAIFPFLLGAAENMVQKNWQAVPKMAIGYALLAFASSPLLLAFCFIPFLYVLWFAPAQKWLNCFMAAITSALLGACLAAIQIIPMFANQPFLKDLWLSWITEGEKFYNMRLLIGFFLIIIPLIGLYIELPKSQRHKQNRHLKFFGVAILILLFLNTPLSKPLWDHSSPINYLQYPARLFIVMLPLALYISMTWLPYVKSKKIYAMLSIFAFIIMPLCTFETAFSPYKNTLVKNIYHYHIVPQKAYRTKWDLKESVNEQWELPESYLKMPQAFFSEGDGTAEILQQKPREILLHAEITSDSALISLKRFYFPGWTSDNPEITIGEKDALITVTLPKGTHDITLRQPWFAGEKEGMTISLLGLITLLFLWFRNRKQDAYDQNIRQIAASQPPHH